MGKLILHTTSTSKCMLHPKLITRVYSRVSCGLFVMWCIKYWDGDRWTYEFNQEEINASRPRIVAEIIFSEVNKLEKVKMKIVKIMERNRY